MTRDHATHPSIFFDISVEREDKEHLTAFMDTRPRPTIKRVMNTQFDCTLRFIGGDQYSLRAIGRGVTPMSCFETPSRKLSLRENCGGSGSTVGRAMVSTRVPSLLFVISRNLANISLVISGRTKFPPRTRDIHPRPTNELVFPLLPIRNVNVVASFDVLRETREESRKIA